MSVDIYVFISREKMPTPASWQAAIKAAGFNVEMDLDFDVHEFMGYLPCTYDAQEAGFEYCSEDADLEELCDEGMLTSDEVLALGERRFLLTLATRSDYRDGLVAAIAAGVLCAMTDGVIAEDGMPPFIGGADALAWARKEEKSFIEFLSSPE